MTKAKYSPCQEDLKKQKAGYLCPKCGCFADEHPGYTPPVPEMDRAEAVPIGKKYDSGKPRFGLLPPRAELEVVKALTFGADKYGDNNWRDVEPFEARYTDAKGRHANARAMGERKDPDSGLAHRAHEICNLLFLLERELEEENQ